jgi:Rv2525c-like, glycoside hydrolase-like domain
MSRFGLDYAWGHISPAAHKAAGSSFAARYLSYDSSKNLSLAEKQELEAGGIDIVVVWETSANRALSGYDGGRSDGGAADSQAKMLGQPEGRPIYFAVDFDVSSSQQAVVNSYFQGVAAAIGLARTGVYGGYWPCKRLKEANLVTWVWQTYAWSGGNVLDSANFLQYSNDHTVGGLGCDYNKTFTDDFGQWGFVTPPTEDQIMAITSGNDKHGNLHVFVEASDGSVWYTYQPKGGTAWNGAEAGKRIAGLVPFAPAPGK